ncbi:MAG: chitin deacetylase [Geminicoccaceae bacterium]|nr:MAG: chitin deacetylase [Geminicoccaceae bacterium]
MAWPGGARVAVSFVVNVEEGAELSLGDGDEANEHVFEIVERIEGAVDLCMESHFEYGTRAGYWRIMDVLERHGATATMNASARAVARSPWLARDAKERGHEVAAHGYRWERHAWFDEAQERALIRRTVEAIRDACGERPIGWHTRSSASPHTRRLLLEEGGFLYDSDAYNDDVPFVVEVAGTPHLVLPYAFDTNDMRFFAQGGFTFADDFTRYCSDAFDWLWDEGAKVPKMMTIGLHLRIIGRPGRIAGLDRLLAHMRAKGGVWFASRCEIAHHARTRLGLAPA